MDFNLTTEQRQFADAMRRWTERQYAFAQRRHIVQSDNGVSAEAWRALAELGMTALPVPEAHGGFSGSAVDMMVVMQELGRGLVVEPYFATMLGVEFLKKAGGHGAVLEQVAAGAVRIACALGEKQARHDLFDIAATVRRDGGDYLLNGMKTAVLHGSQAEFLVVPARSTGARRDTSGITLLLVPADAPGVSRTDYRTFDGQRAATIVFADVRVPAVALIGEFGDGWPLLDAVSDYGVALLCAEAVGVMETLNAATLDYLKTRRQFGVPIGAFQALQHRMVDMVMHLEQAKSITMLAAMQNDAADVVERRRTASAAKARVGQAMRHVGQQAVQLHGGMGITDELPAAHYFKRLTAIELTLGDTDHHLARFAAQPGFESAA